MTIAAYATGSEHGYIYLRGEYPLATSALSTALEQARERGCWATTSWAAALRFDIEIRRGAGAYICGEETALFNSIEGYRGEPRNKPPFPVERRPVRQADRRQQRRDARQRAADIVLEAATAFAAIGTAQSTGTEAVLPLRLRRAAGRLRSAVRRRRWATLLDLAGGVARRPRAAGGAARRRGGRLRRPRRARPGADVRGDPRRRRDARLGRDHGVRRHGRSRPMLLRIAAFFRDESCGQCVPCRVGTVRQEEALRGWPGRTRGTRRRRARRCSTRSAQAMSDASICGLGQTACSAIESAIGRLHVFAEGVEVSAHDRST